MFPDSQYSDLFRFATVRNPKLHEPDALTKRFVRFDIDAAALAALPDAADLLVTKLPAARTQSDSLNRIATLVNSFLQASKRCIHSLAELSKRYPTNFASVAEWLRVTPEPALAVLTNKLADVAIDPGSFVSANSFVSDKVTLWENVLALYLQPVDPQLREEIISSFVGIGSSDVLQWMIRPS